MNKAPVITRRVNEFLEEYSDYSEDDLLAWFLANLQFDMDDGGNVLHVRIESDIVACAREAARISGLSLPVWTKRAVLSAVASQVYPILNLFDEGAIDY